MFLFVNFFMLFNDFPSFFNARLRSTWLERSNTYLCNKTSRVQALAFAILTSSLLADQPFVANRELDFLS